MLNAQRKYPETQITIFENGKPYAEWRPEVRIPERFVKL